MATEDTDAETFPVQGVGQVGVPVRRPGISLPSSSTDSASPGKAAQLTHCEEP